MKRLPTRRLFHRPVWDQRSSVARLIEAGQSSRYRLAEGGSRFALTFDDGPDPAHTPAILDLLDRHQAQATFFVLGNHALAHPGLVRDLVAAGHEVGSHSMTHRRSETTNYWTLRDDFRAGREAIEHIVGRPVRLFRPPHGHVDVRTALIARTLDLDTWMWSTDPEDYRATATAEAIADRVELIDGAVVLLHDGMADDPAAEDRSATVDAVSMLLDRAALVGLRSVALPT